MDMKVGNLLSSIAPGIDDQAIATLRQTLLLSDATRGQEQVPEQLQIFGLCPLDTHEFLAGDDQEMGRRLGINIPDGDAVLVLVHTLGGDLPLDDAGEEGGLGQGQTPPVTGYSVEDVRL